MDRRSPERRPAVRARPRLCRARISIGDGQAKVSARSGSTSARWRLPPTTSAACATSALAAGEGRRSRPRRGRRLRANLPWSWRRPLKPVRLLILGGTSNSSALARRLRRSGLRSRPVARRRDRQSGAGADPAARRRLRRPRGPRGLASLRAYRHRCRCDPPLRRAHVGQRGVRLPRDRDAARRFHPPAVDPPGRRPLERGRDHGGGGRRARARAQDRVPARKAGSSSPPSPARRSTATSFARSIRRPRRLPSPTAG